MKKLLVIGFIIMIRCNAMSQGIMNDYQPIEKLGWEMVNFSEPENLTVNDVGELNYLLILNKNGRVVDIKVLTNTFTKRAEKLWRKNTAKLKFKQRDVGAKNRIQYKGTLFIKRDSCKNSPELTLPDFKK